MSVRVAVFGTSRSGKDYSIEDATELLAERGILFTHISPISMVRDELVGRSLRYMPEDEKHTVIANVRSAMAPRLEDEYVFVDEHYAFPLKYGEVRIDNGYYGERLPSFGRGRCSDRLYDIVFDESWMGKYDLAIYMDIDPEVIHKRFRLSPGDKNNPFITCEDIRAWQMFEIKGVRTMCKKAGIPLFYVYNPEKTGEEIDAIVNRYLKQRQQEQKYTNRWGE